MSEGNCMQPFPSIGKEAVVRFEPTTNWQNEPTHYSIRKIYVVRVGVKKTETLDVDPTL